MSKIIKYLEQANDILQSGDIRGQATLSTIGPTDRNLIEIAKMIQLEEHRYMDKADKIIDKLSQSELDQVEKDAQVWEADLSVANEGTE